MVQERTIPEQSSFVDNNLKNFCFLTAIAFSSYGCRTIPLPTIPGALSQLKEGRQVHEAARAATSRGLARVDPSFQSVHTPRPEFISYL
eukprot:524189-Rhodomonas_salina.5